MKTSDGRSLSAAFIRIRIYDQGLDIFLLLCPRNTCYRSFRLADHNKENMEVAAQPVAQEEQYDEGMTVIGATPIELLQVGPEGWES